MYAKYGDDEEAVRKAVEGMKGFSGGGNEFDNLVAAIGGQESGGNYNAKNGRTGASGKYQIMPDNWPSWSREAGLPAGAEMTPENQEIVARFKLKQYYDKYGARGAAIAWYGGEGALKYSADAMNRKQGNGDEPSINEYADSVLARMGTGHSTRSMSQDEQDRIMKQYRTIKADHDRIETYKKNKLFEGIKNELFSMFNNGTSYSEAMAWATNQAGSDPDKYVTYRNAVVAIYGPQGRSGSSGSGSGSSNGKLDDDAIGVLEDMLQEGKFASIDQFLAYAANKGASSAQRGKLEKIYKDWYSGTGEFAFDMEGLVQQVAGKNADALYKKKIQNYGRQWVRTYRAQHGGNNPGETELLEALQNCVTTKVYGSYVTEKHSFWFDSTEDIKASDADLIARGIASVTKTGDDWYDVKWLDGTSGKINGAYLAKLLKGDY